MAHTFQLYALLGACLLQYLVGAHVIQPRRHKLQETGRQRVSIDSNWRFWRSETNLDGITYDNRTDTPQQGAFYLKPYILPSANDFYLGFAQALCGSFSESTKQHLVYSEHL